MSWATFHEKIEPQLAQYCYSCHGPEVAYKDFRLDIFKDDQAIHTHFDALLKALAMLASANMPPPCEYQLTPQELKLVIDWITARQKLETTTQLGG